MSKIYEALLRAEQDRADKERTDKEVVPQSPTPSPANLADAQPVAAQSPFVSELQTPPALEPTAYASAVAESVVSAPDFAEQFTAEPFSAETAVVEPVIAEPAIVKPAPASYTPPRRPVYSAAMAASPAPVEALFDPIPPPVADLPRSIPVPVILQPSDDRAFTPDKVRRCAWTPSFESLPGLEDRGAAVEQFRSLRSRMFEFRDLNKLKSIIVSSGLPQEGKSFIAANLAVSFARHKASRVLLIDGDMRRSTLHKLLGATAEVGLAEYLAGSAGLLDIMQQMEHVEDDSPARLGLTSLTFIPGGNDTEKAADLSGNPRFAQLMKAVSPFYDWIVVDSAPVNIVADGVNLARACDGVLLVARGGITKYEAAQRALVELKASKILGFVLNAVEATPLAGGYYGYESYDSTPQ